VPAGLRDGSFPYPPPLLIFYIFLKVLE
jgi:hypothetical protein